MPNKINKNKKYIIKSPLHKISLKELIKNKVSIK